GWCGSSPGRSRRRRSRVRGAAPLRRHATRGRRLLDCLRQRAAGLRREPAVGSEHEVALELADRGVDLPEAVDEQHTPVVAGVGVVGIDLHGTVEEGPGVTDELTLSVGARHLAGDDETETASVGERVGVVGRDRDDLVVLLERLDSVARLLEKARERQPGLRVVGVLVRRLLQAVLWFPTT